MRGNEAPVFRPVVRRADNKVPPHGKSLSRNEPMGRAAAARTDGKVKGLARSSDEPQRKAEGQRAQQQDRQRQARQLERRQAQQLEKQHQAQQREADKQLARERQDRERQRQQLEKRQAWERQDLERTHQKEIKSPTRGVSWAELQRQHEQEHRALAEQHHQQQQQLDARRAGQPPRASRIQPAPPRTAENRPRASNPTKPSPPKPNAKEKPLNNR